MRFKAFILNENRSEILDVKEAHKIIEKRCKKTLENPKSHFYRGVSIETQLAMIVKPSKFMRKSKNTNNYYTLLIDNLPAWKNYPKRSKSIVCSTNKYIASQYGLSFYRVYPYDGSKIGVCPDNDIWASTTSKHGYDLDSFNWYLKSLGKYLDVPLSEFEENDWNIFKTKIDKMSKKLKTVSSKEFSDHICSKVFRESWFHSDFPNENTDIMVELAKILDPKALKFSLKKAGDNLPPDREVWTDGTCILINEKIDDEEDSYNW